MAITIMIFTIIFISNFFKNTIYASIVSSPQYHCILISGRIIPTPKYKREAGYSNYIFIFRHHIINNIITTIQIILAEYLAMCLINQTEVPNTAVSNQLEEKTVQWQMCEHLCVSVKICVHTYILYAAEQDSALQCRVLHNSEWSVCPYA